MPLKLRNSSYMRANNQLLSSTWNLFFALLYIQPQAFGKLSECLIGLAAVDWGRQSAMNSHWPAARRGLRGCTRVRESSREGLGKLIVKVLYNLAPNCPSVLNLIADLCKVIYKTLCWAMKRLENYMSWFLSSFFLFLN